MALGLEKGGVLLAEYGIARRHYVVKGEPRTHHLHMVERESKDWSITIGFRDLLLSDAALALEYAAYKKRLAEFFSTDRSRYQKEKNRTVAEMLAKLPRARG